MVDNYNYITKIQKLNENNLSSFNKFRFEPRISNNPLQWYQP